MKKAVLLFTLFCVVLPGIVQASSWKTTAINSVWYDPNNWDFLPSLTTDDVFIPDSDFAPEITGPNSFEINALKLGGTSAFAELFITSGGSLTTGSTQTARDSIQLDKDGDSRITIDGGTLSTTPSGGKGDIRMGFNNGADSEILILNDGLLECGGQFYIGTNITDTGGADSNSLVVVDASTLNIQPGDSPARTLFLSNNAVNYSRLFIQNGSSASVTTGDVIAGFKGNGELHVTGGSIFEVLDGNLLIGETSGSEGVFTLDGGQVYVEIGSNDFVIGKEAGSSGTFTMTGGLLDIVDDFKVGEDGTGIMTMTGGQVVFGGSMRVGDNSGGHGELHLDGGTIVMFETNDGEFRARDGGTGFTDITYGEFIWAADDDPDDQFKQECTIRQEASVGDLTAFGQAQRGGINIEFLPSEPAFRITAQTPDLNQAYAPTPIDGERKLDFADPLENPVNLSWTAGDNAAPVNGHTLFMGTSKQDVTDSEVGDLKGDTTVTTLTNPSYTTATLPLGRYYWRVDENNTDLSITKGAVWLFAFEDIEMDIEDWDDYDTTGEALANWSTTGTVAIELLTDNDGTGFDGNDNMLKLSYTGATSITANPANLELGRNDFTFGNTDLIRLQWRGVSTTGKPGLFLKLTDGSAGTATVVFDASDPNLAQPTWSAGWNEWYIDMTDPAIASNVDLTNITEFTIGTNPSDPAGVGDIYFGDFEVDVPSCVPQLNDDLGDTDGDCDADVEDLERFAIFWTEASENVTPVAVASAPILKYTFDNAADLGEDTSGRGYHATATGSAAIQAAGKVGAGAVNFDGLYSLVVADAADALAPIETSGQVTFAFWTLGDPNQPVEDDIFRSYTSGETMLKCHVPDQSGQIAWQAGGIEDGGVYLPTRFAGNQDDMRYQAMDLTAFSLQWNHYAMTKDFDANIQRIYINGVLVAENRFAEAEYFTVDDFAIGGKPDGGNEYLGLVDEFVVYDAVLSQGEIATLAGIGAPFVQPLLADNPADTNGDGKITLADFANIAAIWAQGPVLWP